MPTGTQNMETSGGNGKLPEVKGRGSLTWPQLPRVFCKLFTLNTQSFCEPVKPVVADVTQYGMRVPRAEQEKENLGGGSAALFRHVPNIQERCVAGGRHFSAGLPGGTT